MRLVPSYYKGFQINVEKNKSHTTPDREKPELTEREKEELGTMGCMLSSQKGDKIFFVVVTYVWLVAIEYCVHCTYIVAQMTTKVRISIWVSAQGLQQDRFENGVSNINHYLNSVSM